jgi:hypothetical protein
MWKLKSIISLKEVDSSIFQNRIKLFLDSLARNPKVTGSPLTAYFYAQLLENTKLDAPAWIEYGSQVDTKINSTTLFTNSLTVTDLDGDGIAEVTFAYATGCRLGVDPDDKTLVFYEGANLYKIKGTTSVIKGKEKLGGAKQVEKKFDDAPDAFLEFANKQWNKFGEATASK